MVRWLLGSLAVAACYSPSIAPNGLCGPGDVCPEGQTCVAEHCVVGPGSDGLDAASRPGDRDGDGVPDGVDNCPDVANADQGNEDGDRFGDACDPCPPVADNAPTDSDGDGVADACDPHPQTPGDKIALFEGFHHGVPTWMHSASWTAASDAVRVASASDTSVEFLVLPITSPDHITFSAQVVVEQTVAGGDDDIDVVAPEDVGRDDGVDCELHDQPLGGSSRFLWLYDGSLTGDVVAVTPLAWTNNTAYQLALTRKGTSFTCSAGGSTASPLTGTSSTTGGASPAAAIRAYGMTARIDWVMVVRNP